jgi:hypothetical protein
VNFLERTIQDAMGVVKKPLQQTYAQAMLKSLTTDRNFKAGTSTFPIISRLEDITADGLDSKAQYDLRVGLLKPIALEFLSEVPGFETKGFNKKSTWKYYEERFGELPFFIHHNPRIMMLTYAQWLHLTMDQPPPMALPNELKAYLEQ